MLSLSQIGAEGIGKTTFINTLAAAFPFSQAAAATAPTTSPAATPSNSSTCGLYPKLWPWTLHSAMVTIDDPDTEIRHNFVLQVNTWTPRFLKTAVCCLTQLMTPMIMSISKLQTRTRPGTVLCGPHRSIPILMLMAGGSISQHCCSEGASEEAYKHHPLHPGLQPRAPDEGTGGPLLLLHRETRLCLHFQEAGND